MKINLEPGEMKEFVIEVEKISLPEWDLKRIAIEVCWTCAGCGKDGKKWAKLQDGFEIRIACDHCTPLWMKIRNFVRGFF